MRKYWLYLQIPLVWTGCRSATNDPPQYLPAETVAVAQPANLLSVVDSLSVLPREQWVAEDVLAAEGINEAIPLKVTASKPQNVSKNLSKNLPKKKVEPPPPPSKVVQKSAETLALPKPDVAPSFPGGDRALIAFLRDNRQMPKKAVQDGVRGTVYVRFTVAADGAIRQPKIEKSLYPYLDMEALRLVGAMPKWVPAQRGGQPVAASYSLSISFE